MTNALVLLVVLSACTGGNTAEPVRTTVASVSVATSTTAAPATSTSFSDPEQQLSCDASPYFPDVIPERAAVAQPGSDAAPFHPFLSISGTSIRFLVDSANQPVLAVIRGALPPEQWASEPEVIEILDGIPAALGPLSDGVWAVGWILSETDPCDLYSLIVFPPTSAEEAREVATSL
ncbi:MAG: hypothetical protein OEM97_08950 [Acidimicrobiia bacterium]|nr:hypothetical protein [Acidimicrobiia bacterium]